MLSAFHVKPTHVTGDHRIPAYTFRILERQEHRIPAYTARILNQREPVYQAVCKEVNTYTKKDSPVYQPHTKRKMSRIPSVYRAQVIARRGHIPIVYQLMVYHHLCHSVLFAGFGNSSKQNVLEAMVCKAIWYEAPNDLPLSFEHVLLERAIRFELSLQTVFLKSENYKNVTSK